MGAGGGCVASHTERDIYVLKMSETSDLDSFYYGRTFKWYNIMNYIHVWMVATLKAGVNAPSHRPPPLKIRLFFEYCTKSTIDC